MKKIFLTLTLVLSVAAFSFAQIIKVSFADSTFKQPFSGHVLLYLSKDNPTPKEGTAGLDIFPCLDIVVKNVKPGTAVTFDDDATAFPVKLSDMERGEYYLQAVWDRNLGGRLIAHSPGNMYSLPQKVNFTKDFKKIISVSATKVAPEPVFKETQHIKELKAPSALLSKFLGKPMTVNAAVILPKEYFTEPNRKFPVLFTVSGYGGDYHRYSGRDIPANPVDTTAVINVYLDGNCALGHSVYANSDNN